MNRIHIAVTRHVKPGLEGQFEQVLRDYARESLREPGTTGVHLIGPLNSGGSEYGFLRSFEDEPASEAFYRSELYQEFLRRVAPLVDGEPRRRKLTGLEAFFRTSGSAPPKWKMVALTWLGVVPTVHFWGTVFSFLPIEGMHPLLVLSVRLGFVVATLGWVVMPLVTKAFGWWLAGRPLRELRLGTSGVWRRDPQAPTINREVSSAPEGAP
ncbi:MAG: antibiotic biosynthesis monooxygenase [Planctomycetota bacterium]|nr:MAG: antibiotic biosynthesis monooxygenase [Planctomycetota bacterium]